MATLSSVQFSRSVVSNSAAPWIAGREISLSITNSRSLLKLMPIESVMPSSHLILCHPLLLLPPVPPSIRVFSYEPALHMRWPEYWSFSFSISPSNEHPGLISFRMDWLDLLAVHGTLKSLLQCHGNPSRLLIIYSLSLSSPSNQWDLHGVIILTFLEFYVNEMTTICSIKHLIVFTYDEFEIHSCCGSIHIFFLLVKRFYIMSQCCHLFFIGWI